MTEGISTPTTAEASLIEAGNRHGIADFSDLSRRLEESGAEARICWALEHFGDCIGMSSSFGAQSAVLLHLVTRQRPDIPVILVDTGYLFAETYRFVD